MESCTYISSQNPPLIVLLLWPKIDRVSGPIKRNHFERWWLLKINPKHALVARQPFSTRTNRRSPCVRCWTLFISLPCTQNLYKSSLVLKSSQIVNAPRRHVKDLLFDDGFEGLRRGFLCSWHRLCLLKISPLSWSALVVLLHNNLVISMMTVLKWRLPFDILYTAWRSQSTWQSLQRTTGNRTRP